MTQVKIPPCSLVRASLLIFVKFPTCLPIKACSLFKLLQNFHPASLLKTTEYVNKKCVNFQVQSCVFPIDFQANTQELGKDKWLCPLSGKKFKGPDFVRKHIFNKHGEKVDEVKKEVQYYNNYLKDPKRPQLPENPKNGSNTPGGRGGRDSGSGRGRL